MRATHTIAELPISGPAYDEIRKAFEAAGYEHAIRADGMLDMSGVGITRAQDEPSIRVMETTLIRRADGTWETKRRYSNEARMALASFAPDYDPLGPVVVEASNEIGTPSRRVDPERDARGWVQPLSEG